MTEHVPRPLAVSTLFAVGSGVVGVLLVANTLSQVVAVTIAVVGLVVVATGLEAWHRGYRVVAALPLALGSIAILVALGWGAVGTRAITEKLELVPGLLGLAVLVVGLGASPRGYERWFVNVGTGLILLGVFLSGLLHGASTTVLLAATAATIIAWDCGEQAINLGEHLGRQARTWPMELVHGTGAVIVGGAGVVVASVVFGAGVSGLPLVGLTTMVGALVLLAITLYT